MSQTNCRVFSLSEKSSTYSNTSKSDKTSLLALKPKRGQTHKTRGTRTGQPEPNYEPFQAQLFLDRNHPNDFPARQRFPVISKSLERESDAQRVTRDGEYNARERKKQRRRKYRNRSGNCYRRQLRIQKRRDVNNIYKKIARRKRTERQSRRCLDEKITNSVSEKRPINELLEGRHKRSKKRKAQRTQIAITIEMRIRWRKMRLQPTLGGKKERGATTTERRC